MWKSFIESSNSGRSRNIFIERDGKRLTYAEILRLWQQDPAFRDFFSALLRDVPYAAFRWETPAITCFNDRSRI